MPGTQQNSLDVKREYRETGARNAGFLGTPCWVVKRHCPGQGRWHLMGGGSSDGRQWNYNTEENKEDRSRGKSILLSPPPGEKEGELCGHGHWAKTKKLSRQFIGLAPCTGHWAASSMLGWRQCLLLRGKTLFRRECWVVWFAVLRIVRSFILW